jgi:hypothetical protein
LGLLACGGSSRDDVLIVPTEMPEICKGIDFTMQPDMRDICGVRPARYQSYKNIPQQRYLIMPKGASMVKKDGKVELRLPNTLPIPLPISESEGLSFSQDNRLVYLKNTMIYKELFPSGQARIKMFKLQIPLDDGNVKSFCFNLPETKVEERKRTYSGTEIEPLQCTDFDNIVTKFDKK